MAANAPPSLLIIKKETVYQSPVFNLLLCKLCEGWLYGNCSLVLYICRCTLCRGHGNCLGVDTLVSGISFRDKSWNGTDQVSPDVVWWQGPAYRCHPRSISIILTRCSLKSNVQRSLHRQHVDKLPKATLSRATSPNIRHPSSINYWLSALIEACLPPIPSLRHYSH